ncbi:NADH:flavin oxidoreductase [candidate division KSB1 bacterium]
MKAKENLFSPIRYGRLTVPNRFVRSATNDRTAADGGRPGERTEILFRELARGDIGLIITGHAYVHPSGIAGFDQWGIHRDDPVPAYRRVVDVVHSEGGRVMMQLAHAGRQSRAKWVKRTPMAPSAVHEPVYGIDPAPMSEADIETIIEAFVLAAVRARVAGFDGVQLHAAHGYLISQFLSPHTNRRDDSWGGDFDGRFRFLQEIYSRIRKELGDDYPILVKMNSTDGLPGGLDLDDAVQIAARLDRAGIDGIEVSGGMAEAGEFTARRDLNPEAEAYFLPAGARIKAEVNCPVISVGGHREYKRMNEAVEEGRTDAVALSRPFIREPDLVRLFRAGQERAACISCNGCFGLRIRPTRCAKLAELPPWAVRQ